MLVTGLGRLTKDPNLQRSESGVPYVQIDLACKDKSKDKDGNYTTSFIVCKAFKGTAELLVKLVKKGNLIYITGDLKQRTYTNKDNNKTSIVEVIINEFTLCESKKGSKEEVTEETPAPTTNESLIVDGDLPF